MVRFPDVLIALGEPSQVGIFALAGVVIGGLLNYVATAALERRREARALRVGARLVTEEIARDRAIIEAALEVGSWLPVGNAALSFEEFGGHRTVLAAHLSPENWRTVCRALRHGRMIQRVHSMGAPDRPFSPMDPGHLRDTVNDLRACEQVLERY